MDHFQRFKNPRGAKIEGYDSQRKRKSFQDLFAIFDIKGPETRFLVIRNGYLLFYSIRNNGANGWEITDPCVGPKNVLQPALDILVEGEQYYGMHAAEQQTETSSRKIDEVDPLAGDFYRRKVDEYEIFDL